MGSLMKVLVPDGTMKRELEPPLEGVQLVAEPGPEVEFVDASFLARMNLGAQFLNAGRGKTIDTEALVEALRSGRIRAALDVTDPEPLPADHSLWRVPNVLITPRIAGAVALGTARLSVRGRIDSPLRRGAAAPGCGGAEYFWAPDGLEL